METPPTSGQASPADERLDSWKEIAAYLKRSVRGVQRWEAEEGMPVHRHRHDRRGTIFAFKAELDAWWRERGALLADDNGAEEPALISAESKQAPGIETSVLLAGVEEREPSKTFSAPGPRRRSSAALIGSGFALVSLVLVAWLFRNGPGQAGSKRTPPFQARDWVLVAGFENRTGEALFDDSVQYALERDLANSRHVSVVPRERIGDTLRLMRKPPEAKVDARLGREICLRDGGIRALLTGSINKTLAGYRLTADVVNPTQDIPMVRLSEVAENRESVILVTRRLSDKVRQALGERSASVDRVEQSLSSVTTPSLRALQLYSRAEALLQAPSGLSRTSALLDFASAEELLRQAVAEDPEFASAYIDLAWALHNQGRPREDWKQYAETAFRLSATTTERERYFIRGSYYQLQNQDEKAIAAYQALLSLYPDHFWGTTNLAELYTTLGRSAAAVAIAVQRADMRPRDIEANGQAALDLAVWAEDPVRADVYVKRALALVSEETAKEKPGVVGWVEIFAASRAWVEGDMPKALRELDLAAAKVSSLAGLARESLADNVALSYLTLGRLRAAERSYEAIPDHLLRHQRLSHVVFARNDAGALRRHLQMTKAVNSRLSTSVVYLARAKLLPEARRAAADRANDSRPGAREFLQGEIALAAGDLDDGIARLEESLNGLSATNAQWGFLLGSESLAAALQKRGNLPRAIEVLERTAGKKVPAAFERAGPFWLRTRFALSQLYRLTGRDQDARRVESELSALLVYADPDHPIRRELDRLKGS